jgi:hypothetical protein
MEQLTVRGFQKDLKEALVTLAETEGLSLNRAALELMRRGAGLSGEVKPRTINHDLDEFFGTMSHEEICELNQTITFLEQTSS